MSGSPNVFLRVRPIRAAMCSGLSRTRFVLLWVSQQITPAHVL